MTPILAQFSCPAPHVLRLVVSDDTGVRDICEGSTGVEGLHHLFLGTLDGVSMARPVTWEMDFPVDLGRKTARRAVVKAICQAAKDEWGDW